MKIVLLIVIIVLLPLRVYAGINKESGCYQQVEKAAGKGTPFFFFQSYRDDDLEEYVGAFVNYNNSKNRISLVFHDEIQGEGSSEGEYQKYWLEVINKKVTGQYVEHGNYKGNAGGRYIKYTAFRSNRTVVFRIAMVDNPCTTTR